MLNNLMQPHEYPGKLFVVEGIDGSGKTTQLGLLAKWLVAEGHRVFVTEWNSSALVKAATKTGKKKNALTPMTFSLLHATDFADRLLYKIIPPLKAGMIVLADRYAYTAFAPCLWARTKEMGARNCDRRAPVELGLFVNSLAQFLADPRRCNRETPTSSAGANREQTNAASPRLHRANSDNVASTRRRISALVFGNS